MNIFKCFNLLEENLFVCPICKYDNEKEVNFCISCGYKFQKKPFSIEDNKKNDDNKIPCFICTKCKYDCKKKVKFCIECGHEFTNDNQKADENNNKPEYACPQCTFDCKKQLNFCPMCTHKFDVKINNSE